MNNITTILLAQIEQERNKKNKPTRSNKAVIDELVAKYGQGFVWTMEAKNEHPL